MLKKHTWPMLTKTERTDRSKSYSTSVRSAVLEMLCSAGSRPLGKYAYPCDPAGW